MSVRRRARRWGIPVLCKASSSPSPRLFSLFFFFSRRAAPAGAFVRGELHSGARLQFALSKLQGAPPLFSPLLYDVRYCTRHARVRDHVRQRLAYSIPRSVREDLRSQDKTHKEIHCSYSSNMEVTFRAVSIFVDICFSGVYTFAFFRKSKELKRSCVYRAQPALKLTVCICKERKSKERRRKGKTVAGDLYLVREHI